ncbi:hypothetical protein HBE96_06405 [Clostridium sp. P21]|uniref:Uncharacterized protein n=1 Tax=Clostridium muellerianum TaxID=2716538 RepID=A0A7Y0HLU4_9CLOT|nr:hypothetical protein [Clostridium muellerianum]NMM62324.1 hypothetical protein [Clostridium muellerianum]
MENSFSNSNIRGKEELSFKNIEEYETNIINTIEDMISKDERICFAIIAERSDVTRFVIRQYPELRNYILKKMAYYKEIQVINKKINRSVRNLLKNNRKITFISLINKCKFSTDTVYHNEYIKQKLRSVIIENAKKNCT